MSSLDSVLKLFCRGDSSSIAVMKDYDLLDMRREHYTKTGGQHTSLCVIHSSFGQLEDINGLYSMFSEDVLLAFSTLLYSTSSML